MSTLPDLFKNKNNNKKKTSFIVPALDLFVIVYCGGCPLLLVQEESSPYAMDLSARLSNFTNTF